MIIPCQEPIPNDVLDTIFKISPKGLLVTHLYDPCGKSLGSLYGWGISSDVEYLVLICIYRHTAVSTMDQV